MIITIWGAPRSVKDYFENDLKEYISELKSQNQRIAQQNKENQRIPTEQEIQNAELNETYLLLWNQKITSIGNAVEKRDIVKAQTLATDLTLLYTTQKNLLEKNNDFDSKCQLAKLNKLYKDFLAIKDQEFKKIIAETPAANQQAPSNPIIFTIKKTITQAKKPTTISKTITKDKNPKKAKTVARRLFDKSDEKDFAQRHSHVSSVVIKSYTPKKNTSSDPSICVRDRVVIITTPNDAPLDPQLNGFITTEGYTAERIEERKIWQITTPDSEKARKLKTTLLSRLMVMKDSKALDVIENIFKISPK